MHSPAVCAIRTNDRLICKAGIWIVDPVQRVVVAMLQELAVKSFQPGDRRDTQSLKHPALVVRFNSLRGDFPLLQQWQC